MYSRQWRVAELEIKHKSCINQRRIILSRPPCFFVVWWPQTTAINVRARSTLRTLWALRVSRQENLWLDGITHNFLQRENGVKGDAPVYFTWRWPGSKNAALPTVGGSSRISNHNPNWRLTR